MPLSEPTTSGSKNYNEKHNKRKNNEPSKKSSTDLKRKQTEMRPPIEKKKPKSFEPELPAIADLKVQDKEPNKPETEMTPEVEARTIFVSNLDYSVTEEQIKIFIGEKFKNIRLVKDFKGRSKGFGYVELKTPVSITDLGVPAKT